MAVNTRDYYYVGDDGGVVYYTSDGLQCKSKREAELHDAVGKLEKELRKLYPFEKYPKSVPLVWRLVFMFMDCAHVVWFVLQFWLGLVVLPFWMDRLRLVSQEHGWKDDEALCFLLVAVVNSVTGWFLVLISFWRLGVRESLLLLVSDVAPPEAEILLLEWKRNRSTCLDAFDGVRQFVWIRVIEKARSEGYSVNMDHTSTQYKDIELQKITGELRDLLLSRPSVDVGENEQESEESAWQYDHSLWRYKDVWPEGLQHSAILLLGDLLFSPLGCFARSMNCLILLTLTGILVPSHLIHMDLPWGVVCIHYWIFILFSWEPYRAIKKHCLGN